VEQLARRAEERFGGIDVWINNAGVYLAGRFEDTPPDAFRRVIEVNFFGYVNGARVALPRLRARRGVLINNASVAAAATYPYFSAYVASKWAVRGWSATLRQELFDSGVDVCTILPASIDTPLFQHAANYTGWFLKAMNPVYTPEMVADAMIRCAERPTREVIVGGAGRMMAAQWTLAPRLAERMFRVQAESDHFRQDQRVAPTPGTLFEPMREGTDTTGGWGGSRLPDQVGRAATVGLAVAGSAVAWLATRSSRNGHLGPIPVPFRRRENRLKRLLRSVGTS
ncbi:MAG: SDR family NAD(P)-dependent oxidoreductase, partial [Chloroflexota bacterium]|nr:SDR family NAD(P)-dependent oxidoreductase [Chloroflexota bacterium]